MIHEEYERRCLEDSDIAGHLPFLYESVCRFPSARVLELGVRWGNSTAAFLAGVEKMGGHLWSVDIAKISVPQRWHGLPFWTFIRGDDLEVSLPEEFDIVFIDTSHEYEHTLRELEFFAPRVKRGLILLHDTDLDTSHVRGALGQFRASWTNREGYHGLGVIECGF